MPKAFNERILRSFLDILILTQLEKNNLSGYDITGLINDRFGIFISPGTVYNTLHSLETKQLIEGVWRDKKRIYKLSKKGNEFLKVIREHKNEILDLLEEIFSTQP
ncbi:PadR family transcriptional regulator [Candidatus Bathyarchaeota archaeon]|nr:PadR family transcriptional regulator [Candidatus Bathyarchaeota archaeon]